MPSDSSSSAVMAPAGSDHAPRPQNGDTQFMPAAKDEELAVIFREMRRASEHPLEDLAARLKTSPATIVALESGEIAALPEWGETSRVVSEYTAMLHLDARPVLRRLERRYAGRNGAEEASMTGAVAPPVSTAAAPPKAIDRPPAHQPAPKAAPPKAVAGPPLPPGALAGQALRPAPAVHAPAARAVTQPAQPVAGGPSVEPASKRPAQPVRDPSPPEAAKPRRSRAGAIITLLLLLAVFGAMALGVRHAIQHPEAVWSTVDSLPEPAPQMVRSVWELLRPLEDEPQAAPADPRSQKSDRLPGAGAPQGN